MTLAEIGELGLLARIQRWIATRGYQPRGLGDDAAILPGDKNRLRLFATDAVVEGVDFNSKESPKWVGRKALAVNLSDIAAMGGTPEVAAVALGMPASTPLEWLKQLYEGILDLGEEWRVQVVGGDLSKAPKVFVAVAMLGRVAKGKAILRNGAKVGDFLFVTGSLGGSILGKHLRFTPRLRESHILTRRFQIHSMIDISDGLIQDLSHILRASGVGARVYLDRIPLAKEAFQWARKSRRSALQCALSDGEDFELLFTVSPKEGRKIMALKEGVAKTPVSCIGDITAKKGRIDFFQNEFSRRPASLRYQGGYEHF